MAEVFGQVDGAALGPKEKGARQVLPAGAARGVEDALDGGRLAGHERGGVPGPQKPQLIEGRHGVAQVLGGGLLVHAIRRGHLGVGENPRHGLVGQQHRLLHKPRRARPVAHAHAGGVALFVEDDLGLARLEVDGAPGTAGALPQVPDVVEHAEHLGHVRRLGGVDARQISRRDRAREQLVHLVVAQARVRSDRRGAGLGRDNGAAGVQPHAHRHGQPVLPRTKRAHVVAQALREHRDHAVHKVNRARA